MVGLSPPRAPNAKSGYRVILGDNLKINGVLHGTRGASLLRVIHIFEALFRLSLRCNIRATDVKTGHSIVMIIVSSSVLISESISAKV